VQRCLGYELPPARKAGEFVADVDTLFNKLKSVFIIMFSYHLYVKT
jgi:hypothetical protein